jgi:hypothetical protein
MTITLHFHGDAGTVTGSCYRILHPGGTWHNGYARLLIRLGRTLDALPDDAARRELLRPLTALLRE